VEAEWCGACSSHRDHRGQVAFFARAHHRHRGAMTRRLRHIECQIGEMDRVELSTHVIVDAGLRKQEGHFRSISLSTAEEHFDELTRVTAAAAGRLTVHGADTTHTHHPAVEYSSQVVLLDTADNVLAVDQSEGSLAAATPGRFHPGRVKLAIRVASQAGAKSPTGHVGGPVEKQGRAICRLI
jgi:hypothetical protein